MSIELLELADSALGELSNEVIFVGGATIELWITDPGAPPARATEDVDVIVEVASRTSYQAFEERLRAAGFRDEGTVICRWLHDKTDLVLDAMPTDPSILGFENRWQGESIPQAVVRELPSGHVIRAVPPAFLLATKLEAFAGRGEGDLLGSTDFADIVALVDGREELVGEVRAGPKELRAYIATELTRLMDGDRLLDGVHGQLQGDDATQERAETIVIPRMRLLVEVETT